VAPRALVRLPFPQELPPLDKSQPAPERRLPAPLRLPPDRAGPRPTNAIRRFAVADPAFSTACGEHAANGSGEGSDRESPGWPQRCHLGSETALSARTPALSRARNACECVWALRHSNFGGTPNLPAKGVRLYKGL